MQPATEDDSDPSKEETGLVYGDNPSPPESGPVCIPEDEPESLQARILRLPAVWQRLYIAELFRTGSPAESRLMAKPHDMGVSVDTVRKAIASNPLFSSLAKDAMEARHERVDLAIYKGATEGDSVPLVSQGQIVGDYKKRDTKAGELYMKRHGLMADQQGNLTVTMQGKVEVAQESDLAALLSGVAQHLFGAGQPVIEAEAVSETDKK